MPELLAAQHVEKSCLLDVAFDGVPEISTITSLRLLRELLPFCVRAPALLASRRLGVSGAGAEQRQPLVPGLAALLPVVLETNATDARDGGWGNSPENSPGRQNWVTRIWPWFKAVYGIDPIFVADWQISCLSGETGFWPTAR